MPTDPSPEHAPAPNPVELIEQLEFGDVTELSIMLRGGWKKVTDRERHVRRRALGRLHAFVLDEVEAPEFAEVEVYLDTARQVTAANVLRVEGDKFRQERADIKEFAHAYVSHPDTRVRLGLRTGYTDFARAGQFLAANLYQLTITARVVALRNFQAQRNGILRAHFTGAPTADSVDFLEYVQTQPITWGQIGRAEEEVGRLRHQAPYADFFQLSHTDQDVIVAAVGKEWEELCALLYAHSPSQLEREATSAVYPLAYRPVRELREAIAANPAVSSAKICQAFLRHPQRFPARLGELRREIEQRKAISRFAAAQSPEREDTSQNDEGIALSANQQEIQKLLAEPEVKEEVLNMPFGTTVVLTDPATETSGPQLIYRTQLESIIDKNLRLLGRSLYEVLPGHNPRGVTLPRWEGFNVGEALRAGFAGAMSDLTMTRLPVSQADLDTRLPKTEPPKTELRAEDVSEVVFTVNMRSSGRGAGPAMLRLMLIVRTGMPRDTIAKSSWKPRSTGADLVASLREEAARVAYVVEAHHRRNPFSGGLPGLGKS